MPFAQKSCIQIMLLLFSLQLVACEDPVYDVTGTLLEARADFQSKFTRHDGPSSNFERPEGNPYSQGFSVVSYDAPKGMYSAYLYTPTSDETTEAAVSEDGKIPAMIWINGGDCNAIGDVWTPAPRDDDQTAAAFRKAGMVVMYPSMRGANGRSMREGFLGEVDDVIAARDWLARRPDVDPNRIYLGGHSTGGTMALLVAECSDQFRAVFSFGPVDNVAKYGPSFIPVDMKDIKEIQVRSPGPWLKDITVPTFIIEGTRESNYDSLRAMDGSGNPNIVCLPVKGADHFNVLGPINDLFAQRILQDTAATCNIKLTEADLKKAFGR